MAIRASILVAALFFGGEYFSHSQVTPSENVLMAGLFILLAIVFTIYERYAHARNMAFCQEYHSRICRGENPNCMIVPDGYDEYLKSIGASRK